MYRSMQRAPQGSSSVEGSARGAAIATKWAANGSKGLHVVKAQASASVMYSGLQTAQIMLDSGYRECWRMAPG